MFVLKCLKYIAGLAILMLIAYSMLVPTGCARIGHPSGGPKDTLPPVLLKTQPIQGALFFNKEKISIAFSEYVQLKDIEKQFIMSPPPDKRPTISINGKRVQVFFNSPLKDSTTYQLNFGNAIADNNEGNIFPAYRFAFSTGDHIDSMRMGGIVLDAATDQPVNNALVFLYETTDDSVVMKIRPNNLIRPNDKGLFVAENLKDKPYKIVVLDDANKNYKYDIGQESIGFLDKTVEPMEEADDHDHDHAADTAKHHKPEIKAQLALRMFKEEVFRQYLTSCTRPEKRAINFTFNAPYPKIDSFEVDELDADKFVIEHSARHDTLTYWLADTSARVPDSLYLSFVYLKTDTLGQLSPQREKRLLIFEEKKHEEQSTASKAASAIGGLFGKLLKGGDEAKKDSVPKKPANWTLQPNLITANTGPTENVSLSFNALLISTNPRLIKFKEQRINPRKKDTTYIDVKYWMRQDTMRLRKYRLEADWRENTSYSYTIFPHAFCDIYGQTNDTMRGVFTTVNPERLSTLIIDFKNVDGNYIVQLTDAKNKNTVREHRMKGNEKLHFRYINPSTYCIRIIKDDNNNGKWDTGNYFKHIQPEYATFLKGGDGKLEFGFRQGWDVELSVDMKNLFPDKVD